jgi:hypothetical protein
VRCPVCGEMAPDDSRFCSHCGATLPASEAASAGVGPSGNLPERLSRVSWVYDRSADPRNWYSGFEVWFALEDSSGRPTSSDGELTIKLRQGGILGHRFKITVPVRKEDFSEVAGEDEWPTGGFGYLYQRLKPALERKLYGRPGQYHMEVFFKTPDGRELHAVSEFFHPET